MKIALDVEGTLADVHRVAFQRLKREREIEIDIDDVRWDFEDLPGLSIETYLECAKKVWKEQWREIPPLESDLSESLLEIGRIDEIERMDIVTSRDNCKTEMKRWLHMNQIPYKRYIIEKNKYELDYDIFIDDNPNLVGKVDLILSDRPWNRDVDEGKVITRIGGERSFQDLPYILREVISQ